mgnify:CR=1 FL=1
MKKNGLIKGLAFAVTSVFSSTVLMAQPNVDFTQINTSLTGQLSGVQLVLATIIGAFIAYAVVSAAVKMFQGKPDYRDSLITLVAGLLLYGVSVAMGWL